MEVLSGKFIYKEGTCPLPCLNVGYTLWSVLSEGQPERKIFTRSWRLTGVQVLYVLSFTQLSFFGPSIEWNMMTHRIRLCRSAAPWVWKPGFRADDIKTVDPSQTSFPVLKRQKSFRSWPGLLDYLFVIPIFQGHSSIFFRNPVN